MSTSESSRQRAHAPSARRSCDAPFYFGAPRVDRSATARGRDELDDRALRLDAAAAVDSALLAVVRVLLLAHRHAGGGRIPEQVRALGRVAPERLVVEAHEHLQADRIERACRRRDL